MKRLAVLLLLVCATPAQAATDEVKFCNDPGPKGWQIAAGNSPPKFPKTTCAYARATYRAAKTRPGGLNDLPSSFKLRDGSLSCTAKSSSSYAEFRCRNASHFVLAYAF